MIWRAVTVIACVCALALGACDQGQSAPSGPEIKVVHGHATVEAVEVVMDPSQPSQAQVVARGYLTDGCTRIDRVEVNSRRGNLLVSATITTVRPADFACIQAIQPFEERIAMDLSDTPHGTYVVEVNGLTHSFRIGSGSEQRMR
jgi:inhibitor of cysteine peptidase